MASLKELRGRIKSVKATQKITKAMKMVAASKLRRARMQAESSRPYADNLENMMTALAANAASSGVGPGLLVGNGKQENYLLVVMAADRGLCGGYNASVVKMARRRIAELHGMGKKVTIFCIGKKSSEGIRLTHSKLVIDTLENITSRKFSFVDADEIAGKLKDSFEANKFDVCEVVFSKFKSAISQIPTVKQLIPLGSSEPAASTQNSVAADYIFEPSESAILDELLPRNLSVQIYTALLESAASEQGARMSAMDNATRNAGDMIKRLSLVYNRSRQATITKELIEIISGADAV